MLLLLPVPNKQKEITVTFIICAISSKADDARVRAAITQHLENQTFRNEHVENQTFRNEHSENQTLGKSDIQK